LTLSKNQIFLISTVIVISVIGVLVFSISQNTEDKLPETINNVTKQDTTTSQIIITSVKRMEDASNLIVNGMSQTSESKEIKIVEVQLGDAKYKSATPSKAGDWSEWSITLDTSTLDDGTHSIVARVIDDFGDEELDGRSFNYNLNPITITNPPYDAIVSGESITITGTTYLENEEIKIVEVQLGDAEYKPATPSKAGDWSEWSITLDTSTLTDGTHSIVARVIDNSGDEEWDTKFFNYISSTSPIKLHEEFSDYLYDMEPGTISPDGNWFAKWHDDGYLGVTKDFQDNNNNVFVVESGSVDKITETKSAMILSSHEYKNFKLSVDVRTDRQTRQSDPPNAWEVGWLVWSYNDPTHFNYFLLKSNGSEMGKYDGGVNPTHQKILFTDTSVKTSIGKWTNWEVIVQDSQTTILVDDTIVFDFDDFSSFDSGRIGFYLEDASVSFDNFTITPLS
jgi:hypothetical protein